MSVVEKTGANDICFARFGQRDVEKLTGHVIDPSLMQDCGRRTDETRAYLQSDAVLVPDPRSRSCPAAEQHLVRTRLTPSDRALRLQGVFS